MNYSQIMSPCHPLPLKVGGHVPPAPMGAPPMQLVIRRTRLATVGDSAFPVSGSRLCNSLLPDVISAPTLTVFQNRLKTYLFSRSFPSCFRFFVLYSTLCI